MYLLKGFVTVDSADSAASKHQTELSQLHQQNFSWISPRLSSTSHTKTELLPPFTVSEFDASGRKICATPPD